MLVAEDQADLLVRLVEASDHAGIVKDLSSPFGKLLWKGAKKVKRFDHDRDFLATVDFLIIGIPRAEDVSDVWE